MVDFVNSRHQGCASLVFGPVILACVENSAMFPRWLVDIAAILCLSFLVTSEGTVKGGNHSNVFVVLDFISNTVFP